MGMYTELVLGVDLNRDTPIEVIDILNYMIEGNDNKSLPKLPDHPLFNTDRWHYMLVSDSCYFGGCTNTCLQKPRFVLDTWHLSIRSNFKNYHSEIELFLDWLLPYIETTGFIGYMRYEEYDRPWLIYNEGHIQMYNLNKEKED